VQKAAFGKTDLAVVFIEKSKPLLLDFHHYRTYYFLSINVFDDFTCFHNFAMIATDRVKVNVVDYQPLL